jgi:hypothetical protein
MRNLNGINNAPPSAMEISVSDKERLSEKEYVQANPDRSITGLELAGLKPCNFGVHNKNFNKHNI